MNRWLEKIGNAPDGELTKLTKGGSVSSVSASPSAFEEKNASGNRWLAKLGSQGRRLAEVPQVPRPRVSEEGPLAFVMEREPANETPPAPLQEVERIIRALSHEVGRDLGEDLVALMRRTMGPLDRPTRAGLAAEIDDAFATSATLAEARERAGQAIRGKVGDPPPITLSEWLDWIEARCPINAGDRRYIADRLKWLHPERLATPCRWYVQAWTKAAAAEPKEHRKENAGRREANQNLLALGRYRNRSTPDRQRPGGA